MSGWLSKATNVFKQEAPDTPRPFQISCFCGADIQGLRQQDHQRVTCRTCGTALFILPRDVYPVPPQRDESEVRQKSVKPVKVMIPETIPILEEPVEEKVEAPAASPKRPRKQVSDSGALPTLSDLRQRIRDAEKPKKPPVTAEAVPAKSKVLGDVGAAIGELGAGARKEFVRFWTPFRILALVVVVAVMVTGAFMLRQSILARAVRIAREQGELGLAAIEKEEWTVAREHLQAAAAALDQLGRKDPEAQTIRQYARETQAQFRLCDFTLTELLNQAQGELQARDEKDKSRNHLVTAYRGDWLLLEGVVRDGTPEKAKRRELEISLPFAAGGQNGKTRIRVNFASLEDYVPLGGSRQVIVAGALQDCEQLEDGTWLITLDPQTGFLWTHLNTYRAIGFDFNPLRTQKVVEAELAEQAEAMGVPQ